MHLCLFIGVLGRPGTQYYKALKCMVKGVTEEKTNIFLLLQKTHVIAENNVENTKEMKFEISPSKRIVIFVI